MAHAQDRLSRPQGRARVIDAESWIVREGASATLRRAPVPPAGRAAWLWRLARSLSEATHPAQDRKGA